MAIGPQGLMPGHQKLRAFSTDLAVIFWKQGRAKKSHSICICRDSLYLDVSALEKEFVVPPSGGILSGADFESFQKLPPEGGTTKQQRE